jgi:glycopeptide antibiotics resistance protein
MLVKEEKEFLQYWEQNRVAKKKWVRQLSVGLPLGVALVLTTFVNLFSGWYGRAQMVFARENTSLVLVLLVAAIAIVLFVIIFSARHRWEMNEQRYLELKYKE